MAPNSTSGLAKRATGWSALLLAAQVAFSPVAASPLNVAPTSLAEAHSAGQKRDQWFTVEYYEKNSCHGDPFLQVNTGMGEELKTDPGCLNNMKDPYTMEDKCMSSFRITTSKDTWNGANLLEWTMASDANCKNIINEGGIWLHPGESVCSSMATDTECIRGFHPTVRLDKAPEEWTRPPAITTTGPA